jgi:hypothetical protein
MNESQIEGLLHSLKPVSPSADLLHRVEQSMQLQSFFSDSAESAHKPAATKPSKHRSWHEPVAWASVGAAAAALVVFLLPPREVSSGGSLAVANPARSVAVGNAANMAPVSTQPVAPAGQVVSAKEEGIIQPSSGQPVRRIRTTRIIQQLVVDPSTGAQSVIQIPVEEFIDIPVQVQ